MRVTTKVIFDIRTGQVLHSEGFSYDGPWALAKKGKKRKREEQRATKRQREAAESEAATASQRQSEQYDLLNNLLAPFQGLGPNQLTPYSQAQYGSDLENIVRTYRNIRESGQRALMQRGLARSPSGLGAHRASLDRAQAESETGAYRNALGRSEAAQWNLAPFRQNLLQFFDPANRRQLAGNLSQQRFDMDLPSAAETIAPLLSIGSQFVPGGQFFGPLASAFGKKKSGGSGGSNSSGTSYGGGIGFGF